MKNSSLFDQVLVGLNIILAFMLALSTLTPYFSARQFPIFSILGLTVPVLFGLNVLFLLYWVFKRKWLFLMSFFGLLIANVVFGDFVKLWPENKSMAEEDLTILSYNVRGFNKSKELPSNTVFKDIKKLIEVEAPDILCIQEVHYRRQNEFPEYPYRYLDYIYMSGRNIMAIFSKYPILEADLLCFPDTSSLGAYADILKDNDTIRIYNLHLQSLGITPGRGVIRKSSSEKLYGQLAYSFAKQEEQAKMFLEHSADVPHPIVVCGDFNSTQFSRTYDLIKGDKKDTFIEMGKGFGRTYIFHGLPVRIDFILADPEFEVISHKNFNERYSDHYPVLASVRLN